MSRFTHSVIATGTNGCSGVSGAVVDSDGFVLERSGHFAHGQGTRMYDATFRSWKACRESLGYTVELVADGGVAYMNRLGRMVA